MNASAKVHVSSIHVSSVDVNIDIYIHTTLIHITYVSKKEEREGKRGGRWLIFKHKKDLWRQIQTQEYMIWNAEYIFEINIPHTHTCIQFFSTIQSIQNPKCEIQHPNGYQCFFSRARWTTKDMACHFLPPEACPYCAQEPLWIASKRCCCRRCRCGWVVVVLVLLLLLLLLSLLFLLPFLCLLLVLLILLPILGNIPIALPGNLHLRPPWSSSRRNGFVLYVYRAQLGFTGAWIYIGCSWEWPVYSSAPTRDLQTSLFKIHVVGISRGGSPWHENISASALLTVHQGERLTVKPVE